MAISLSVLVYYYPPTSWAFWPLTMAVPRDVSANKSPTRNQSEPKDKTVSAEAEPDDHKDKDHSLPKATITQTVTPDPDIELSPQTTPKANTLGIESQQPVPTFSLESQDSSDEEDEDETPPSFPAANSAQRTSANSSLMGPPLAINRTQPPASRLMAPPPRIIPSNLRELPTSTNSLRIPSTGPLPNRSPPRSNGLGLPPAPIKTPNARGKVLLSPGHSPLDWASLLKSGKNLSGVSSLMRVTPSQLKHNSGRKGRAAWSSYQGKVYNITPYIPFHPGGEGEIRRAAGKDGSKLFMEVHPWVNWENMLGECLVGIMVAENDGLIVAEGSLEDMD